MTADSKRKPWLQGVVDTLVGAKYLQQSAIPHRNRLVVILLDSGLETGCRAFLKQERNLKLEEAHRHRDKLMKVVKAKLPGIDDDVWGSLDFYYNEIRNDFYHDSASKTLTESAVLDYEETVYFVLDRAFSIRLADIVQAALSSATPTTAEAESARIEWSRLASRTDRVLAAVGEVSPRNVEDVNNFLKKEGVPLRLRAEEFTNIVARNSGSKNLFYFDRDQKRWVLSSSGKFKLASLERRSKDE